MYRAICQNVISRWLYFKVIFRFRSRHLCWFHFVNSGMQLRKSSNNRSPRKEVNEKEQGNKPLVDKDLLKKQIYNLIQERRLLNHREENGKAVSKGSWWNKCNMMSGWIIEQIFWLNGVKRSLKVCLAFPLKCPPKYELELWKLVDWWLWYMVMIGKSISKGAAEDKSVPAVIIPCPINPTELFSVGKVKH